MKKHVEELSTGEIVIPQRPKAPLWVLALLAFSPTFAMHVFVPALPAATADLNTGIGTMQMTISLYILGLAFGQLIYGPISDRFGRRPTLVAGLLIYTLAGIASALAPSVGALITARLFQALGGCAGLVLGRAIVRDTSPLAETAKQLALMNLMVTLGPAVAPLVGSVLALSFGWRAVFVLLGLIGVANLVFIALLLPETGRARLNPDFSALARHYRQLISSPAFLGYSVGGGCATTSMYAFIAVAPFVFENKLHRPEHEVGVYIALLASGVWLGSFLTSRLITRVPIGRLLVSANLLSVIAAFALLAATLTDHLSVPLVIGCMFLYTVGVGTAAPAALTKAVSINPFVIGSASGLYGFAQMAVGAICTAFAGLGSDPALSVALVLATAGIIAQISFWVALRDSRNI